MNNNPKNRIFSLSNPHQFSEHYNIEVKTYELGISGLLMCAKLSSLEALYETIEDLTNLINVNINIQMLMLIVLTYK